jgi:hypothetical protein
LQQWHAEKGRWAIKIGSETVLLKPDNVVP